MIERARHHYIYVIQDLEFCKVGHANDPTGRLRSMETGNPREMRIAHLFRFPDRDGAVAVEGATHRFLRDQWIRGEWFHVTPAEAAAGIRTASQSVGAFIFSNSDGPIEVARGCLMASTGMLLRDAQRHRLRAGTNW